MELPSRMAYDVATDLAKEAAKQGYAVSGLTLVYYIGMDQVVTTIKQCDPIWESNDGTP